MPILKIYQLNAKWNRKLIALSAGTNYGRIRYQIWHVRLDWLVDHKKGLKDNNVYLSRAYDRGGSRVTTECQGTADFI